MRLPLFTVLTVYIGVLIVPHAQAELSQSGPIEAPSVAELSLFPELYLGKKVRIHGASLWGFTRTGVSSDGRMVFSGIIRGSVVGMSGSYAEIGTKYIGVVVPYEIVLGMVRGDWSCLVPKRFDCVFDVFVAKGGEENLVPPGQRKRVRHEY